MELRQRKRNKRYTQLEQKEKERMGVNYCGYCCDTHIAGIFKEEKPFVCTQQKKWIHIGALHKTGSMQTKKKRGRAATTRNHVLGSTVILQNV